MTFIKNYQSLAQTPQRKIVLDLIEAAFASIQPEEVIRKNMKIASSLLQIQNEKIDLASFKNIYLLGFGKGSAKNTQLIEELLQNYLSDGWAIDTNEENFKKIKFTKGTHPLPSTE